jgi:predicted nucleic acid-binding protein
VSYLVDTDILSMLERRNAPAKVVHWIQERESEIFISVVSLAEIQFGVDHAPASHQRALSAWFSETRRRFSAATEELSEPALVRWKELLVELRQKNRTMTCEDSLIAATALYYGHTIATHNRRHFEPAGVAVVDPLE